MDWRLTQVSTKAKKAFDLNVQRAGYFLDIHEKVQPGAGAPTLPLRELPRGSIVFAVGALDAYLSEVSAEVIVGQLANLPVPSQGRELLRRILKDMPTLPLEVALLPDRSARAAQVQQAIVEYFQNHVSQHGAKAVAATIQRIGGNPDDVWSALVNRSHSQPQQELNKWTEIRHEIVHQGKKPRVWRPHARAFIAFAQDVVSEVDKVAGANP